MKTASVFFLSAVLICAILAPRPAAAIVSIDDFQGTVQGAETIVRAKVAGVAKAEFDRAAHVVTLKVEKTIAGRADPEIRLFHGTSTGYEPTGYKVGQEYYLCLVPAAYFETGEQPDNFKGMYGEAIEMLEKGRALSGDIPNVLGALGQAYALSGRRQCRPA